MRSSSTAPKGKSSISSELADLIRLAGLVTCAAFARSPASRARVWNELSRQIEV